jgi:phosphate transport system ATP-binding protein
MYLGEVIEEGSAEEVFHHPKHELTQEYLNGAFS